MSVDEGTISNFKGGFVLFIYVHMSWSPAEELVIENKVTCLFKPDRLRL